MEGRFKANNVINHCMIFFRFDYPIKFMKKNKFYVVVLTCFLTLFVVISFTPCSILPDLLHLGGIEDFGSVYNIIIGSTASFIGIVIAIILLRFEALNDFFGRMASKYISANSWFKTLVALSIVTILWSFLAFLFKDSFDRDVAVTHLYIVSILFIVTMIVIFPAITGMLSSISHVGEIHLSHNRIP